jgi:hypothetical protein
MRWRRRRTNTGRATSTSSCSKTAWQLATAIFSPRCATSTNAGCEVQLTFLPRTRVTEFMIPVTSGGLSGSPAMKSAALLWVLHSQGARRRSRTRPVSTDRGGSRKPIRCPCRSGRPLCAAGAFPIRPAGRSFFQFSRFPDQHLAVVPCLSSRRRQPAGAKLKGAEEIACAPFRT